MSTVDRVRIRSGAPRRRAGRVALVAVVALVAGAGTAAGLLLSGGGSAAATFGPPPSSYVVVYRNVVNGVPQWEVLAVRRPLLGSDLTYRGALRPAVTARADGGTIATATGLYTEDANGVRLVSGRQPGPPPGDLWLSVETREALARGLAVDLHRARTVAGVRCSVLRLADPPSGPLHRLEMRTGHDDLCLARDGLVLAETWTYHGAVVEQRSAMTVSVGGGWPAGTPRPESTAAAAPQSAAGATVTSDPDPVSFLAPPRAPAGFVAAQPPVAFRLPDPQQAGQTVASTVVWAFVRGSRVMTVEAGRERGGLLPWSATDTATSAIRLPGLGPASTALRSDGPEVRVDLGGGRWVRIRGTVPLSQLVGYAATLRPR